MIKVKYPRRGFVVEEVTKGCETEGCSAKKLIVIPWEDYGEHDFNELTENVTVGQNTCDFDNEGACHTCQKPVIFLRHFIVTSDANTLKTAEDAYYYALNVLKAPFPEGEVMIATSAYYSYRYAIDILKAPFPLGEAAIATDAEISYLYAKDILKAPFELGEKAIATHEYYYKEYKKLFPEPQVDKPNSTTMKTDELDGAALDFMVSRCSIYHEYLLENVIPLKYDDDDEEEDDWSPSTNWKQGGVYIHLNNISICYENENQWKSYISVENTSYGSTPLVSSMRCFVKSKFGVTVDIPNWVLGKELVKV